MDATSPSTRTQFVVRVSILVPSDAIVNKNHTFAMAPSPFQQHSLARSHLSMSRRQRNPQAQNRASGKGSSSVTQRASGIVVKLLFGIFYAFIFFTFAKYISVLTE
jgi:hypothetical protein